MSTADEDYAEYYSTSDDDELYFNPTLRLEDEEVLKRYTEGYLLENADSSYSQKTLIEGAELDLEDYIRAIKEDAQSGHYDDGYHAACEDQDEELAQLRSEVDRLKAEALEIERPITDGIARFMESITIKTLVDVDDVEAWAHQDGWNEAIEKITNHLGYLKRNV